MNDESAPPPLRLKPRVRPPEAPPEEAASEVVAPKLRVKPRMNPEFPAEKTAAVGESSGGDPGAVREGGLESSKFKFRNSSENSAEDANVAAPTSDGNLDAESNLEDGEGSILAEEVPAAGSVDEMPLPATASPLGHSQPATAAVVSEDPPVFPVMAPDLPVGTDGSALIGGLPGGKASARGAAAPPPEQRKSFRYGVVVTMIVLALVLSAGTYYILKHFFGALPPPPPAKVKVVKPPVTAATVAAAAKNSSAPANPVVKAKDAIAGRRADEQARVNALANGEEPSPSPKPVLRSSGTVAASSVGHPPLESSAPPAEPTLLAPGVTTQVGAEVKATDATPEFRTFVASARISGVFQGSPPRAFINGKLARGGDMVDPGLGVTFDHVDGTKKELVFKDASGAIVTRKY